ncbi:MAG TPA: hypothetical protein VIE16_11520 [Phenylobacterium sp.]|jgi:hypothetical protein
MEALKLIPQVFFEFFARLAPGAVAFAIWLGLFDGREVWKAALDTLSAGHLDSHNVTPLSIVAATAVCYVLGQLAAPFGKAMQRICENVAAFTGRRPRLGRALLAVRKWPDAVTESDAEKLRKTASDLARKAAGLKEPAEDQAPERSEPYDWLRANRPTVGALAAKIRAEQTMFHAMSAIFLAAFIAMLVQSGIRQPGQLAALLGLGLACAVRGHSVSVTFKDTSRKLREALDPTTVRPGARPVDRRRTVKARKLA